jgi:hypothetical protein
LQAICGLAILPIFRYTEPLMSAIATLLLLAALQSSPTGPVMSYHERLLEYCDDKAGLKCCRASVHAMRAEQARLKPADEDCPNGLSPMSLSCPASFNWCSSRTIEQVRGGASRGDKIYNP